MTPFPCVPRGRRARERPGPGRARADRRASSVCSSTFPSRLCRPAARHRCVDARRFRPSSPSTPHIIQRAAAADARSRASGAEIDHPVDDPRPLAAQRRRRCAGTRGLQRCAPGSTLTGALLAVSNSDVEAAVRQVGRPVLRLAAAKSAKRAADRGAVPRPRPRPAMRTLPLAPQAARLHMTCRRRRRYPPRQPRGDDLGDRRRRRRAGTPAAAPRMRGDADRVRMIEERARCRPLGSTEPCVCGCPCRSIHAYRLALA